MTKVLFNEYVDEKDVIDLFLENGILSYTNAKGEEVTTSLTDLTQGFIIRHEEVWRFDTKLTIDEVELLLDDILDRVDAFGTRQARLLKTVSELQAYFDNKKIPIQVVDVQGVLLDNADAIFYTPKGESALEGTRTDYYFLRPRQVHYSSSVYVTPDGEILQLVD